MKTTSKKTGNNNAAAAALAEINGQIEALKLKRVGLAQPLKTHFDSLRSEMVATEIQIRELDPSWKPASLKPRPDDRIKELISAKGPMTETELVKALGDTFGRWKVKQALKKRFTVDAAGKVTIPKA
jgi:hypothetical protein